MDCSSPNATASLCCVMIPGENGNIPYDIAIGNNTDSDRHEVATPDGFMSPNRYLVIAIGCLLQRRPG